MKSTFNSRLLGGRLMGSVALLPLLVAGLSAPAFAQANPDDEQSLADSEEEGDKKAIVVTGTLIRGEVPAGTNTTGITKEEIQSSGAVSASEVLAQIPQLAGDFFNDIPQVSGGLIGAAIGNSQQIAKAGARQNPGGSDTGNSTLILVDGNRTSGTGVGQNTASPDTVPAALLERVEVSLNGGSSIYGSDAIGGVVNFITRRKFDGVQISGRYGLGINDYRTYNGNVIVGKDWGSGSAFVSYSYAANKPQPYEGLDFWQPLDFRTGLFTGLNCSPANIVVGPTATPTRLYAAPAAGGTNVFTNQPPAATGTPNTCAVSASSGGGDIYHIQKNTRHNVLGSVAFDFSDSIRFTQRVRYTENETEIQRLPTLVSRTVNTTSTVNGVNIFRRLPAPDAALNSYTVLFNLGAIQSADRRKGFSFNKQWGTTSQLDIDLSDKWHVQSTFVYDESSTNLSTPAFSTGGALIGALNPFDVASSPAATIASILNFEHKAAAKDRIYDFKTIVNGTLFDLPGGEVKIALGGEFFVDRTTRQVYDGVISTTPLVFPKPVQQEVSSVFGELAVPIVSEENSMPGIYELRLSGSFRYDDYNTVGSTTNPRLGGTYKPVEWIAFKGSWGTSFRAPTTLDILGQRINTLSSQNFVILPNLQDPANLARPGEYLVALQGTSPDLKPQTGKDWSYGVELTPIKGFSAGVSYYKVKYTNLFSNPAFLPLYPALTNLVVATRPATGTAGIDPAVFNAFVARANVGNIGGATPLNTYTLLDIRLINLAKQTVSGLDYSLKYNFDTSFGNIFASLSGSYDLSAKFQAVTTQPVTDIVHPVILGSVAPARNRLTARTGLTTGWGFRTTFTLSRTAASYVIPNATTLQDRIKSFNQVTAFAAYKIPEDKGVLGGTEFSLTVNNLFNTAPPFLAQNGLNGYANGDTPGRLIQFGIEKKF